MILQAIQLILMLRQQMLLSLCQQSFRISHFPNHQIIVIIIIIIILIHLSYPSRITHTRYMSIRLFFVMKKMTFYRVIHVYFPVIVMTLKPSPILYNHNMVNIYFYMSFVVMRLPFCNLIFSMIFILL
jgi:hypothetical protein